MLSREKRKIYSRKIRNFWVDFSHNKIGFLGLLLLFMFIFAGVFASVLAPSDPIFQKKVSSRYSMPDWIRLLPQFNNLPTTFSVPMNLTESKPYETIMMEYPEKDGWFTINYVNDGNMSNQVYTFEKTFDYTKDEPKDWTWQLRWTAKFTNLSYRIETHFRSADGDENIVYGTDYDVVTRRVGIPYMWDITFGEDSTGSGSTYLLRRLYYEMFYEQRYEFYMSKYSTGNYTITPEFMAFTYEGFINNTQEEIETNPIFNQYLNETASGQTNATWQDYWESWNSTDGTTLWEVTNTYMGEVWNEFVEARNVTNFGSSAYLLWSLGKPPSASFTFKDKVDFNEFMQIWNLTFTSIRDEWSDYVNAMNTTDFSSPAYERWFNLNATGQTSTTWEEYLAIWVEIQRQASTSYLNKYVVALEAAPALADTKAKADAYNFSLTGARPTYVLAEPGTQTLVLKLFIVPESSNATLELSFARYSRFILWGTVHGILGTNSFGFDVWTQLVHGARVSLIVGSLAALLSTSLGIIFGVTAGYVAGIADEVIMRMVDILLCLPVLPLLLALSAYWRPNVYYLVFLIAIFGWQGLARIIRSRVLSIREMPFIESARASGAGTSYLIFRHLIPNVFPLAMAAMVLAVPAAILSEAALSFLGFGDPFAPTWGKMLHEAQSEGAFGALAWWYIIPPGLAITLLCVAFVFIGHALDEIVNPRLRRRR